MSYPKPPSLTRPLLLLVAAAATAIAAPTALAQSNPPASTTPTFDVASIRPNPTTNGRNHIYSSPNDGNFRTVNAPIKMLLEFAYGLPETQILGLPSSVTSTNYDIDAKADPAVDAQMKSLTSAEGRLQKQKMLQALLADRFHLTTHQETRELPIYALVAAKSGPKLQPSQTDGTTIGGSRGRITIHGGNNTVQLLAEELAKVVGRPVLDHTAIAGRFDITLRYTPDDGPPPQLNGEPDTSAPSLFTAIQEQLGLKLDPAKAPVPVLIIDHIEPPSEN